MKFTGRMQTLKNGAQRRAKRPSAPKKRRRNVYDPDAGDSVTLTKAQQDLLLHIFQNYQQPAVIVEQFSAGDLQALIDSRLVDCSSGICNLTGMGHNAVKMLRRDNPEGGRYDDSTWIRIRVRAMPTNLDEKEVRERIRLMIANDDMLHGVITDRNTRQAMQRSAWRMYRDLHPSAERRPNPTKPPKPVPPISKWHKGTSSGGRIETWSYPKSRPRYRVHRFPPRPAQFVLDVYENGRWFNGEKVHWGDDGPQSVIDDFNKSELERWEASQRFYAKIKAQQEQERRGNPALAVLNPPARRPNASVVEWSSGHFQNRLDQRWYSVWAEWDKHKGYCVVTVSRSNAEHELNKPWHDEKRTCGYPDMQLTIAAAKERFRYLKRKFGGASSARRENPALAILNPLPDHLERFAIERELSPSEREDFNKAIAKYCEFHGVQPEDISITELDDTDVPAIMATGAENRFLVGIGDTEDVSYSANHKAQYLNSNKKGIPFKHEFPSKPHMATDQDGEMLFVINKPDQDKRFVVVDWMRG